MPETKLQTIQLRPGVNREGTSYAGEGSYYACDKIRFRSGLPEKLGGWVPYGNGTYLGSCKHYAEWVSLSGYYLLGVGTNLKYYILTGGTYFDITPIRQTDTLLTDPFQPIYSTLSATIGATDTTIFVTSGASFDTVYPYVITIDSEQIYVTSAGSTTLSGCVRGYNGTTAVSHTSGTPVTSTWMVVEDAGNGATPGDFVTFSGATAFGPYSTAQLNAEFQIQAVSGSYILFDCGVQSTSATVGGGSAVDAEYQIATGLPYTQVLNGWGAGPWVGLPLGAGSSTIAGDPTVGDYITSSQTSIDLTNASTFPASGYAIIESEIIQYSGKSTNTLTGVTRGISGNATSHMAGVAVNGVVYSAGSRGWGTGFTGGGFSEELRLWSASNFGQNLFFNPRGGGIYYWDASTGLTAGGQVTQRGVNITSASFADVTLGNIVVGNYYEISDLGTTTQLQWNTLAGTTAVVYAAGDQFLCQAVISVGYGSGVVIDPAIPVVANQVLVTDERFVVAYGANDYVGNAGTLNEDTQDPMFIAWTDQENPQVWYPTVTNQAGSYRLTYGSRIIMAVKTRQEILVFTDTALYSQQFLGSPYVYNFNPISVDITVAGPNCAATVNGMTFWMGQDTFFVYSGVVNTLPCSLRQYVFDDINMEQSELIYCGTNVKYNEIWWFYPSANSVVNDRYVIYSFLEKIWYYGTMERSAWLDSHIIGNPVGAVNQITVQHEVGADDGSVNPIQPIYAYIESSDFDIGDGGYQFSFVKRVIPDVDFIGSTTSNPSVTITLTARNYPGELAGTNPDQASTIPVAGAKVSTQVYTYTRETWMRIRGRQLIFKIESDSFGTKWQMGVPRLQLQSDGRR